MVGWHHPADKTAVKDPRSTMSGRAHIVKQELASPSLDQKRSFPLSGRKEKEEERQEGRKNKRTSNMFSLYASCCLHAKSLQLCQTLCYPVDCSLPGSSVHGVLN